MAKQKEKKQTPVSRLMEYAGSFQYLAVASWVLAAVSAFVALVPFYFIWRLIKEVLRVAPDYGAAQNLSTYGWSAVGFAILSMLIYIGALICSHLAAFRVQANMRSRLMRHILSLPIGFMDDEGSGKIRKIVNESSAATETYLAHQLPDKYVATATPVGLAALLLVFDWKLGLLCLIPVVVAFLVMGAMMGENMKKKMEEYQNALEEMSGEALAGVLSTCGPAVRTALLEHVPEVRHPAIERRLRSGEPPTGQAAAYREDFLRCVRQLQAERMQADLDAAKAAERRAGA